MKLNDIFLMVFAVFWVIILWIEYLQKHPLYGLAFESFAYYGLWAGKLVVYAGVGYSISKFKSVKKYSKGIALVVWALVWLVIQLSVYDTNLLDRGNISASPGMVAVTVFGYAMLAFLVFISAYSIGSIVPRPLHIKHGASDRFIDLFVGLMLWSALIFILGMFNLLYTWLLALIGIAMIGIGYKNVWTLLKGLTFYDLDPKIKPLPSAIYFTLLFLLVDIVVFNLSQASTPVPRGYDSLTFYANLPKLIGGEHGLITGFPPHNWSLIMASGWVLFDSPEVSHILSFSGGLFGACLSYIIGRKYLSLSPIMAMLVTTLWYTLPAFVTQSSNELKIDLALLFLELVAIMAVLAHRRKTKSGVSMVHAVFIGIMMGYLLGVKLTAVYFILALMTIYWWKKDSWKIFLGVSSLITGLVLMLGLDKVSGLSIYHSHTIWVGAVFTVIGIVLMIVEWPSNQQFILRNIRSNAIIGLFAIISFSPWMIKHMVESDHITPRVILFGTNGGMDLDLNDMDRVWKQKTGRQ